MSTSQNPCRLLLLDLRQSRCGTLPALAGLEVVNPIPGGNCQLALSALAVFVAIDSDAAYNDWRERYHPMCPSGFPHIVLLDPYNPTLARRALAEDVADCCSIDDPERMELIVARLKRPKESTTQPWEPSVDMALFFRLQITLDTLPCPIFIKNRSGRYIACNKAFEDQLGLPRSQIIGASVYDIAPPELAEIYDKADIELMARGGTQCYETKLLYGDGSMRDVMFYKSVFLNTAGEVDGISGTTLDITERKLLEKKLEHAAATDFLTGVYNLRTFYELAGQEFRRFTRSAQDLSLIVIDLDFFKEINDSLGHAAGDLALREFVLAVKTNLRDQDIFARAGGDEFRIILPATLPAGAALVAERIRASVNAIEIRNEKGSTRLSISAGICSCLPGDESLDDVTKRADAALYMAKAGGRNRIHPVFHPQ
ncbi:MAG: diguanylate cyclase [Dechloromonas sp.]|uniref:diguanylate cyclase n=1 Tax=Candidatus Dechloromonas phosphorivorans TaxID=2899244 RepID=A0A935MPJ6_9RHOO|nr:diguanylate cyclase [Candidatus Dechloromonas phosphorivorans]